MILLVSGEGPTDIGATQSAQCPTPTAEVAWGPMGMIINKLVEPIWRYEPIDGGGMMFVSKSALLARQNGDGRKRRLAIPIFGRERGQETGYYYKNARTLARLARELSNEQQCQTAAVLFRDGDGTNSAERLQRESKVKSIQDGFEAEGFKVGVPMVPKPKSEAWLLCALQNHPYQNCARFEEISGNDDSPNPAKEQLDAALGSRATAPDLADLVSGDHVDVGQIDMPSFNEFRDRMEEVAKLMLSPLT